MKYLKRFNESEVYEDPIKKKGEETYAYLNKEGAKIRLDNQTVEVVQPGVYHIMQPDSDYRHMIPWETIKVESPMKPYDLAVQTFIKFGEKPIDTPFELRTKSGASYKEPSIEAAGDNIFPLQPTLFESINESSARNYHIQLGERNSILRIRGYIIGSKVKGIDIKSGTFILKTDNGDLKIACSGGNDISVSGIDTPINRSRFSGTTVSDIQIIGSDTVSNTAYIEFSSPQGENESINVYDDTGGEGIEMWLDKDFNEDDARVEAEYKEMYGEDEAKFTAEDMKEFGLWLGEDIKKFKGKSIDELFDLFIGQYDA